MGRHVVPNARGNAEPSRIAERVENVAITREFVLCAGDQFEAGQAVGLEPGVGKRHFGRDTTPGREGSQQSHTWRFTGADDILTSDEPRPAFGGQIYQICVRSRPGDYGKQLLELSEIVTHVTMRAGEEKM